MVITNDVVHAGQSLVHVFLQTLQVLRLFVHRDDGVLQLHQTTFEGRQDGNLRPEQQRSEGEGCCDDCDLCTTLKIRFEKKLMKIKEGEIKIFAFSCVQVNQGYIFKMC